MKNNNSKLKIGKSQIVFSILFFLFSVFAIIFSVICINATNILFIQKRAKLFSWFAGVLVCGLCSISVWFSLSGKEALTKSFFSLYVLIVFALLILFVLQKTGFFEVVKDAEHLQEWLKKAGAWMPLLYILLQYLQVVILPIPSFVSTAAGVALFGPLQTMLYSFIGIILGSITAFYIGRKLGNKAVAWMVGRDVLEKWQMKLKGKDNFLLTVMFLLPFFPDDVLCFMAGLSTMSEKYFLIMILIARLFAVSSTSYTLEIIPFTEWWGILIWVVLIAIVAIAVIIIYKNMGKIQAWFFKRFRKSRKNRK